MDEKSCYVFQSSLLLAEVWRAAGDLIACFILSGPPRNLVVDTAALWAGVWAPDHKLLCTCQWSPVCLCRTDVLHVYLSFWCLP